MSHHHRPFRQLFFLLLIFQSPQSLAAGDPQLTWTDTLVVHATRTGALPLSSDLSTTTIIDLDDLSPGLDLGDVLAGVAGLQVRRYGGLGAPGLTSMRGGGSSGVVIMIDGVPLADAQGGPVDLSTLTLDRFDKVEIHRGLTPSGFGSFGGLGAINLISRANHGSATEVALHGGAFGDVGGHLQLARSTADHETAVTLLLHGRRIDNRFAYLDHNQTFIDTGDDLQRRRANADFRESGAVVGAAGRLGAWRFQGRLNGYLREGGRPGPVGGYESPHAHLDQEKADLHLSLTDQRATLLTDLYIGHSGEDLQDPLAEIGGDPPGTTASRSDQIYLRGRKSLDFDLPVAGLFGNWEGGGSWRKQIFDNRHEDLVDPTRNRETSAIFGRLALYEPAHRLMLSPSLVWRRLEDDFPPLPALPQQPEDPLASPHVVRNLSPAIGLSWEAWPARLVVESHWTRTLREPTWVELFGHRGGVVGNRELDPEKLRNLDLSLRWSGSRKILARAAVFETRTRDAIVWLRNSQATSTPINAGETRTRGLELEVFSRGAGRLRWWGNLTWQQARDRGSVYAGNRLPYLSDLEAALGLVLTQGRWDGGLRVTHESASYRDRYNTPQDEVPARTVWSLSGNVRLGAQAGFSHAQLTAEVVNLTDNRIYDVEGFPLPGRSLQLAVKLW